jgi:hypothetical protein
MKRMLWLADFLHDKSTQAPKCSQKGLKEETLGDRAALFYGAARLEYT